MNKRLCLIVMGCPKNVVEGELVAGIVRDAGWGLTTDIANASAVLVHTCAFIRDARLESESVIESLILRKKKGLIDKIFVSGCLVQDDVLALQKRFPDIDGFLGTGRMGDIGLLLKKGQGLYCGKPGGLLDSSSARMLSTDLPSAYLRISEGCNHRCGFCSIPRLRGKYQSRPLSAIVKEAENLVEHGVRELVIIAQDTSSYGIDIYGSYSLGKLLARLAKIKQARWIRLMYAYPSTIRSDVIELLANEPKLCGYLDMPLQHMADSVLARMRRPVGAESIVERLIERVPEISIRTSFIVGFPGETEREFRALNDFVARGLFEHAGVFEYSDNPDVPSANRRDQITEQVKRERYKTLMLTQKNVIKARHRALAGRTFDALTEQQAILPGSRSPSATWAGRASFQAPEVDGRIIFTGRSSPGSFVRVKVTGHRGYDLIGHIE